MRRTEQDDKEQVYHVSPLSGATGPKKKKRKTELATRVSDSTRGDEDEAHRPSPVSFDSKDDDSAGDIAVGSAADNVKKPSGIILRGGRIRLPDKLMEYLNKEVVPEILYWQTGGLSFSFDSKTAQTDLLDKYFNGSKLTSFVRSLNRWGFRRVFHALLPKSVLSYEHPLFKRDSPEIVKEMKMAHASPPASPAPQPAAAAVPPHPLGTVVELPPSFPMIVASAPFSQPTPPSVACLNPALTQNLVASQQPHHPSVLLGVPAIAALLNQPQFQNLAAPQPQEQPRSGPNDIVNIIQSVLSNQQQQQQQQQLAQTQTNCLLQAQLQALLHQPSLVQPSQAQLQTSVLLQALLHQPNLLQSVLLQQQQREDQAQEQYRVRLEAQNSNALQAQIQALLHQQQQQPPLSPQTSITNNVLQALQGAALAQEQQR